MVKIPHPKGCGIYCKILSEKAVVTCELLYNVRTLLFPG